MFDYKGSYSNKKLWIKNLLAEICHFNTQKYKNLFSQAKSSRFLYVGYSWIEINNLTKDCNFEF